MRCSWGSKPALASGLQVAAGGDRWLSMAVQGHLKAPQGQVHGATHYEPGRGLLVEDRPDQRTLPCLEYVSIPERDPEAL